MTIKAGIQLWDAEHRRGVVLLRDVELDAPFTPSSYLSVGRDEAFDMPTWLREKLLEAELNQNVKKKGA